MPGSDEDRSGRTAGRAGLGRVSGIESSEAPEESRRALEGVPDATDVRVDRASGRADVDGEAEYDELVDAVESVGSTVRDW